MLVTVDIGNTNITIAFIENEVLSNSYRLTTKMQRTSDEYGFMLMSFLQQASKTVEDIEDVIVSSVVPKMMHSFTNAIIKYLKKEPIIIGPGLKTGINVKTDNPSAVGADRIVDLAGAFYTYNQSAIVIDFGTATTFDYIDENATFRYGITAPGLEICAQALSSQAAQLPEIQIKKPDSILGTNTIASMQAGTVYGYIGLAEYIIKQMKKELGVQPLVIATGGLGRIIAENTDEIDIYDKDLTFKGLNYIYKKNKKSLA